MPIPDIERAEDDTLVQAVQRGDPDAFEPLIDRHLTHLRAFIALKAPVPHRVDELAHEAFVYAVGHIREFAPGTSFRAWLKAIAWNLLRAEIQRFSREQVNQSRFAEEWAEQVANDDSSFNNSREVESLEECVKQMPAPMRELLALKYHNECSTDEIARRLQRSLAWVRTVLFRLRQQLKDCIEQKRSQERPC